MLRAPWLPLVFIRRRNNVTSSYGVDFGDMQRGQLYRRVFFVIVQTCLFCIVQTETDIYIWLLSFTSFSLKFLCIGSQCTQISFFLIVPYLL